ncbi:MAG: hypothetical protein GY817_04040 [bacterium]|nr:hypothetical protein [bacterium]
MKYKKLIISFIIIITIFLFINPHFIAILQGRKKQKEIIFDIEVLLRNIDLLNKEIKNLTFNNEYLERVARDKYLMIKPGEEVFKFNYAKKNT